MKTEIRGSRIEDPASRIEGRAASLIFGCESSVLRGGSRIFNRQSSTLNRRPPRGFTLIEVGAALAVLAVCMVLVMQLGYLSLRERARRNVQQVALECAANVLEAARARSWESLTPEWAAAQEIPDSIREQLCEATLTVSVELEAARPLTKRITVEIRCKQSEAVEIEAARLVALIAARSTANGGVK